MKYILTILLVIAAFLLGMFTREWQNRNYAYQNEQTFKLYFTHYGTQTLCYSVQDNCIAGDYKGFWHTAKWILRTWNEF